MKNISYETILDVQKKVNIVDIIGDYLPLHKRGKNYFAICPFHDDHNPSMSISPEKQIYTCFVCGASGNVFNFVANYEKISFYSAVSKIAYKVGINLGDVTFESIKKEPDKNESYYKVFELANKFYQNNINSSYGKLAIKYLHDRNISDDLIKTFEIGLSFDDNGLSKLFSSKNISDEDVSMLGLCGIKDKFKYDVFRNRIMFPIHNKDGHVVAFSGRIYNGSSENKYVNSSESNIFKKGDILYNYHNAINYSREEKYIIIVEGFMDVIRLSTIGIRNVVATMGTAITKEHANLIRHLSKNVILCFDGDKAGEKATISAIDALEKIDIIPRIIRLEDDLDPDDYIIKKGKEGFLNHLNNCMSALDFKLSISKKDSNFNDPKEVSKYINSAIGEINKIEDQVVRELTIKKISKETDVDIGTIKSLIKNDDIKKDFTNRRVTSKIKRRHERAEENLIFYMLKDPNAIKVYSDNLYYMSNRLLNSIACEIEEFYNKYNYINITDFTVYLSDKENLISEVLRINNLNLPEKASLEELKDYVKAIDDGAIKEEIEKLKMSIKEESNVAKKVVLLEKLAALKKKECV